MSDIFSEQCSGLPDDELRRITTRDRADYAPEFLQAAEREIQARTSSRPDAPDTVEIESDDGLETLPLQDALDRAIGEDRLWSSVAITWPSGDVCAVQRDQARWAAHFYPGGVYDGSRFAATAAELRDLLVPPWTKEGVRLDLNAWTSVARSRSARLTGRICAALDDAGILNTVRDADPAGTGATHAVIVAPRTADEAERIASDIANRIRDLYRRAEALADEDDREAEIRIYDLLADLVPDNVAVFYNRGVAQFEHGRFDAAAEDLARALELTLPDRGTLRTPRRSDPWGGLLSGGSGAPDTHPALPDLHGYLRLLVERAPESNTALRTCADAARLRGRVSEARTLYRQLVARSPEHQDARIYLQLLDEDEGDIEP